MAIMYICLCNALKEKEIARAIEGGASCASVYGCFDCQPKCGKCIPEIEEQLSFKEQKAS